MLIFIEFRGNNVVLLPIGFPKIVKEYSFALIAIYYLTKKDVINEIKSMSITNLFALFVIY